MYITHGPGIEGRTVSTVALSPGTDVITSHISIAFPRLFHFVQGNKTHGLANLEYFSRQAGDHSMTIGDVSSGVTVDGNVVPLSIRNNTPRFDTRSPNDCDLDSMLWMPLTDDPHVERRTYAILDHDSTFGTCKPRIEDLSLKHSHELAFSVRRGTCIHCTQTFHVFDMFERLPPDLPPDYVDAIVDVMFHIQHAWLLLFPSPCQAHF